MTLFGPKITGDPTITGVSQQLRSDSVFTTKPSNFNIDPREATIYRVMEHPGANVGVGLPDTSLVNSGGADFSIGSTWTIINDSTRSLVFFRFGETTSVAIVPGPVAIVTLIAVDADDSFGEWSIIETPSPGVSNVQSSWNVQDSTTDESGILFQPIVVTNISQSGGDIIVTKNDRGTRSTDPPIPIGEINPTAEEIKTELFALDDTNNFDDADVQKLAGIQTGAEVNVNADWEAIEGTEGFIENLSTLVSTISKDGDNLVITNNAHGTETTTNIEVGVALTAADIKTLYESNANTNAFTDVFKSLVEEVEQGFLQSISYNTTTAAVTITDNSGVVTDFTALPAPTLANAGKILQQSADGTIWNLVSVAAATQSARELRGYAYAGAINNFLSRSLYAVNDELAMNSWDPETQTFVVANLLADDNIVSCMIWDPETQTYSSNNIPLE